MNFDKSSYTILVVDDIEANVLLLKMLISKEGYRVISAENGERALELVESEMPHLILLDIMMPVMDGYEAAKKLKEQPRLSHIPIIFLSALNSTEHIIKGFDAGGADYVSKPFNQGELLARVNHQISLIYAREVIESQTEELRKIISDRERLYSIIAHDLRSPLASVKMALELLASNRISQSLGDELFELLTMANRIIGDTFNLLDNLLKWTRTQSGRLNVVFIDDVDVGSLVGKVVDSLREIASLKRVELKVIVGSKSDAAESDGTKMLARVDVDMLKTVLRNLISNAIKFSFEESVVEVIISEESDAGEERIIISVRDYGVGISEENQALLFDSETHFSTYATKDEEGSGLGLLLCKEFVKANGGELTFVSEEGVGTTFTFYLPA